LTLVAIKALQENLIFDVEQLRARFPRHRRDNEQLTKAQVRLLLPRLAKSL
jgi:hypothetical protein